MKKRFVAFLALIALLLPVGCSGAQSSSLPLSDGWIVRAERGETDGWQNGFSEKDENLDGAEWVWYSRRFSASLKSGGRVSLDLCDLGREATVWLGGEEIASLPEGGSACLDVTEKIHRSGEGVLVIRAREACRVDATVLSVRPEVYLTALSATGRDGALAVTAGVRQSGKKEETVRAEWSLTDDRSGQILASGAEEWLLSPGESEQTFSLSPQGALEWKPEDPACSTLLLSITAARETDSKALGAAFAKPSFEGAAFCLGGKKLFLRSAVIPRDVLCETEKMRAFVDYVQILGFNAVYPASGAPTSALCDYARLKGLLVDDGSGLTAGLTRVPLPAGASLTGTGSEFSLPAQMQVERVNEWFAKCSLDRLYTTPEEAYRAAQRSVVSRAADTLSAILLEEPETGIRYAGPIAMQPEGMEEIFPEALSDLRYVISLPDCLVAGEAFHLSLSLLNRGVLWDGDFSATLKITGERGVLFERTVAVENVEGAQLLMDQTALPALAAAGEYTVSIETTGGIYPTCRTKTLTVLPQSSLEATLYQQGLSVGARTALASAGARLLPLDAVSLSEGETAVVAGKVSDSLLLAVQKGASLVLIDPDGENKLPFDGQLIGGMSETALLPGLSCGLPEGVISGSFGGLSLRAGWRGEGDCLCTGLGFDADGFHYGSVVTEFSYGSGKLILITADLRRSTTEVGSALLTAAIARALA